MYGLACNLWHQAVPVIINAINAIAPTVQENRTCH